MLSESIEELWDEYKRSGDQDARDRLIVHYAPMVKFVAGRVGTSLPSHIEQNDLISYGIFGLMDAITRFDPGRGLKFESFAIQRIRGAMIDELRSADWVPRSVRHKATALQRAYTDLEARLRRTPTDAEVAEEVGMTAAELRKALGQISTTGVLTLDQMLSDDERDSQTLGDSLPAQDADPLGSIVDAETRSALSEALSGLPERERTVLALYYFENLKLSEIGDVLGVTESRVSQIHAKSMLRLRARLASRTEAA